MTLNAIFTSVFALLFITACTKNFTEPEYLQRAEAEKSKGDVAAAIIETRNALQLNPKNGEARLLLASLYNEQGNGIAAEQEIMRAKEAGIPPEKIAIHLARALSALQLYKRITTEIAVPESVDVKTRVELAVLRADAYLMTGEWDDATSDIETALSADANYLPALLAAARQKLYRGETEKAQEFATKAQAAYPESPLLWEYKGEAALVAHRYPDAQSAYDKALQLAGKTTSPVHLFEMRYGLASSLLALNKDADALTHADLLLKMNSKDPAANYLRGLLAYRKADYATALTYFQRTLEQRRPGSTPIFALLGASSYALGNYEQSANYLTKHLAEIPTDDSARKLLAATQIQLKQPERAVKTLENIKTSTKNNNEILTLLGTAAIQMNDPRASRAVLKKAVEAAPQSPLLRTNLAESYFREGQYDQALAELEKSVSAKDSALQNNMLKVATLLRKQDYKAALAQAQKVVKENSKEAVAHNLLGLVQFQMKAVAAARQQFHEAIDMKADFFPAMLNLALIDMVEGKPLEAAKWYQKILDKNSKDLAAMMGMAHAEFAQGHAPVATEWLQRARQADPTAPQPRLLLARAALERGDAKLASELAQEIMDKNPNNPMALSLTGELQMMRNDYRGAEINFEKLVNSQPRSATARLQLGQAQAALKKTAQARSSFKDAVKLDADYFPALAALANLEVRAGNADSALQLADAAIKRKPEDADGYVIRGDALMSQKNYSSAAAAYTQAAQHQDATLLTIKQYRALTAAGAPYEQRIAPLQAWLEKHSNDEAALLVLAEAQSAQKRHQESIETYQRVVKLNSNNVIALNNLALVYLTVNDARAVETAEQAYKVGGKNPRIADTLGWVLVQRGDVVRGKLMLDQAVQALPDDPTISYHLALARNVSGDIAGARELVRRALTHKEIFEDRPAAEALAKQLN
ncbi:MAG: PEP-CTERM system TPR-repeat protein PrsT [Gammaproteobacteria bacterium]|nr:PEP-CTERM system TPR-repeat protein PrsT [Gammaproteobacteria bacterium]